ncbi:MAG TPA: site-2 protease family protein [Thermoanaerobaculia bacterium]|nr:site-2 protease family protein [Thermoanaerobaculia bacterium]
MLCPQCATEVPDSRRSCPACNALIHAVELKDLARKADEAAQAGDLSGELAAWRQALDLLPPETRQFQAIAAKVDELSRRVGSPLNPPAKAAGGGRSWKEGGALAGIGLLLWKLKAILALVLGEGKLLLLGLGNAGTLASMLLSMGVYWTVFGWKLALGLILSIYIHEMGHVATLRRYGIRGSLPMFIPGFGALILLRQRLANAAEDARVGLAGPLWGLGAALATWAAFRLTGLPVLGAVARWGAWINLFNLLPVWQLDGGRAFHALSRPQRFLAAAALGAAWFFTKEGLLILLALTAVFRALGRDAPAEGDRTAIVQYLVLTAALSALAVLPVPLGARP